MDTRIYRYNFSDTFANQLYKFSKIHQYDDRKSFKDAWNLWTDENSRYIEDETCRLKRLGYKSDITDKMFKSARYYFRKKDTTKKEPVERKTYVSIDKTLLEIMDKHILENITMKPSVAYEDFVEKNAEILQEKMNAMQNINDPSQKVKKTYKNRYFVAINK
jgi:hypothetical protein